MACTTLAPSSPIRKLHTLSHFCITVTISRCWNASGCQSDDRTDPRCWCSLVCPRHAAVTTPFEKEGVDDSTMTSLDDGAAETFSSAVTRLGFLALDHPDTQIAAKEAARGMEKPLIHHQRILRRSVRYWIHPPMVRSLREHTSLMEVARCTCYLLVFEWTLRRVFPEKCRQFSVAPQSWLTCDTRAPVHVQPSRTEK